MRLPGALVALVTCALLAGGAGPAAATDAEADRLALPGVVVDSAAPLPKVTAEAWVLADIETGEVLAASNAHALHRPASTLKILTALAVLPELDPAASYVAQWEDANTEGSRVGVVPDATYTVHNLLEALFLVSGNDAAWALANAAGGVDKTVGRMNELAKELGALHTYAVNPSGLDAPRQRTTAYDLALIARAALARDDVRAYATTVKSQFPGKMPKRGKKRSTFEIYTQNKLLLNYPGTIGLKTGWTTKARGTFVGAATRGDRTLVATVMHTDGDAWREAQSLLRWGFKNADAAEPVGSLGSAQPAAEVAAVTADGDETATALAGSAGAGAGGGLPWWLQVPLALAVVIALLRLRVVVRQRRRTVRRAQYARTLAARARR
jgi:D-alanyl-D-alanine carboxypeptidase (penicillin-binding protein 5/6)